MSIPLRDPRLFGFSPKGGTSLPMCVSHRIWETITSSKPTPLGGAIPRHDARLRRASWRLDVIDMIDVIDVIDGGLC